MTVLGRRRLIAVACIAGLSAIASANGAMGLALEMFDYKPWLVYVAAMIGLEAWFIGIKNGRSVAQSLATAIAANLLTAFCCPGVLTPFLHVMDLNPNPFGFILNLLCGFGLVSAVIEGIIWAPRESVLKRPWKQNVMARSLIAHAIGIPIALLILLLPQRPYLGMERSVFTWRRATLGGFIKEFVTESLAGEPPKVASLPELIETLGSGSGTRPRYMTSQSAWTVAYLPCFYRFDTSEQKRLPIEWNSKAGAQLATRNPGRSLDKNPIWIARWKSGKQVGGYVVGPTDTTAVLTTNSLDLGY